MRQYVFDSIDQLLNKNDIAFLKWDYNHRNSGLSPDGPPLRRKSSRRSTSTMLRNLYSILDELRRKHPLVEIESCSGGGSRVDLGIMRYTDDVWPSDNTDTFKPLEHSGWFPYAYSPDVMTSWVTDSPTWVNNRTLSGISLSFLIPKLAWDRS